MKGLTNVTFAYFVFLKIDGTKTKMSKKDDSFKS